MGTFNCAIWSLMGSWMRLCKDEMAGETAQTKSSQERLSLPQAAAPVFEDYLQDILHNVGGQYAEQQAAVRAQLEMRIDGNITTGMEILDNFPKHITWDELYKMRGNEDIWRKLHKHYFE